MPNMNMEVIVSFVDRLSGPAREAAESLNKIKTSAEGLGTIGEHFTSATTGLRNAGIIFKNAGEGASQLASHLRALEGVNVAPKLEAIGTAAKTLDGAGAHMRSTGKGAEQLATGIRALEGLDVSKVTVIAGALDRVKASGSETTMGSDMGKFAAEAAKSATAVERIEKALGALRPTPLPCQVTSPDRPQRSRQRLQRGPSPPTRTGSKTGAPWQVPGTAPCLDRRLACRFRPSRRPPPRSRRQFRCEPAERPHGARDRLASAIRHTGAPGHRRFLNDMAKAHQRHPTHKTSGSAVPSASRYPKDTARFCARLIALESVRKGWIGNRCHLRHRLTPPPVKLAALRRDRGDASAATSYGLPLNTQETEPSGRPVWRVRA